jgi:hypothetical protein
LSVLRVEKLLLITERLSETWSLGCISVIVAI